MRAPSRQYLPVRLTLDPSAAAYLLAAILPHVLAPNASMATPSGEWITPSLQSPNRSEHMAAYDPINARMIVFGNHVGSPGGGETWSLSLGAAPTWSQLITPTHPSDRSTGVIVYDSAENRMILFGGYGATYHNDVWQLSLGATPQWTQLIPQGSPPQARHHTAAVYDPIANRVLIIGGYQGGPTFSDLWAINLAHTSTWEQLQPSGSSFPATYGHSAIYDVAHDRVLVFAGFGMGGAVWQLQLRPSLVWSPLSPLGTPPPIIAYSQAIYDPFNTRMIVFGGWGGVGAVAPVPWELSLGAKPRWQALSPTGSAPSARDLHTCVFDAGRNRMVVFGGRGAGAASQLALLDFGPVSQPTLSIGDASVGEGLSGSVECVFELNLSAASSGSVTVDYATEDSSAKGADGDYVPVSGTVIIPAGSTTTTITVQVNGDTKHEPDETFFVNLSNASGATIADGQAVGTIVNDDSPSSVSAISPSGTISPATPSLTVPVTIAREEGTPMLGYSVRFHLTNLSLSGGVAGITESSFLQTDNPTTSFHVVENGGGSYTVDNVTLGAPCGSTAMTGTLFQVAVGSTALSGTGSVTIDEVTVYDCSNAPLSLSIGTAASVEIDYTVPLVTVTSPNGGEISPESISWTASDNVGVAHVDLAYSTDGGMTFPNVIASGVANSGTYPWTPPPHPCDAGTGAGDGT